jgi:hypothetical protein
MCLLDLSKRSDGDRGRQIEVDRTRRSLPCGTGAGGVAVLSDE